MRNLKKITALVLILSMLLTVAACGGSSTTTAATTGSTTAATTAATTAGAGIKVALSHTSSTASPWEKASLKFAEIINTQSNGKFNVETFPNGVLCQKNWSIMVEMTQAGSSQIGIESVTALASRVPELGPMQLPFLFDNDAHIEKFLETNPAIWQKWLDKFKDKNLVVLAVAPRKFRQLINNKVLVKTPADIKGLKFRVPDNPFFVKVFELIGAKPVPLPSGEIYSAIQLGTVVGEDNSVPVVYDFKTHEVAKYMTLWNYMADASIIFVNKDFYDGLTEDEKKMYHDAAKEWAKVNIAEDTAYQKLAIEEMTKAGVEFFEMPAENKVPFKEMVQPLYAETEAKAGAEDWAAFMKAVDDARK